MTAKVFHRLCWVLTVAWVVAGLCSIQMLLEGRHWHIAVKHWVGVWHLLTHIITIVGSAFAAILAWRRHNGVLVALAVVSVVATLYWLYYVALVGSTYPQVWATIALGLVTLALLAAQAIARLVRS